MHRPSEHDPASGTLLDEGAEKSLRLGRETCYPDVEARHRLRERMEHRIHEQTGSVRAVGSRTEMDMTVSAGTADRIEREANELVGALDYPSS
jgi:hypothetical protein